MRNDQGATNEDSQGKRYNEKEIIKKFLVSDGGIPFLVDHVNRRASYTDPSGRMMEMEINNIIDYYLAWIHHIPVRRSIPMSKYDFLKYLEDFCRKNDIRCLFDFLFLE